MPLTGSPFVGRERELSAIEELLARAAGRESVVLDMVGPPGIGKTRLLREAIDRGRGQGFEVYTADGSELERELPFGLLAEMLARALTRMGEARDQPLAPEHRDQLSRVFAACAAAGRQATEPGIDERHAIGRSVIRLVTALAGRAPVMLVVDDVHWGDGASIGMLAHLVDRIADVPLVCAFSARRGRQPASLQAAIDRAERDRRVVRIDLQPLGAEHVRALFPELTEPVRLELLRESGGNPFYLEQLAKTLRRDARAPASEPAGGRDGAAVPASVARALAVELAELTPEARHVAHALAVAGDKADPALVAAIVPAELAFVSSALDELAAADLVTPAADVPGFSFRHPIVRRAIYESAPPAWRIEAHGRAAAVLAARGASAARRAHHEEYAAQPGDRDAIALLSQAAGESITVAPATAVRYYRAALRLMPRDEARGENGLALRLPLALALTRAGDVANSREALRDVLLALPEADESRRMAIVTAMAAIDHLLGRYDDARELIERELGMLDAGRATARARLFQALATNDYFNGLWSSMADAAGEAEAHARDGGRMVAVAETAATRSVALGALGDLAGSRAALSDAREAIERVADMRLVAHLTAPFWVGLAGLHLEDYEPARRVLERGIELSRQSGQEASTVQLCVGLAAVCSLTGQLADARRAANLAVDVGRLAGVPNLLGWAEVARCWAALQEGRFEEALEAGVYVERTVAEVSVPAFSGGVCALAEARVLAGDARVARDGLLHSAGGADLPNLIPLLHTWAYATLTQAELALGAPDQAAAWAEYAERSAARLGLGRDLAFARLSQARVAFARGDLDAALEAALASADAAQGSACVPQVVQARILAGVVAGRRGDGSQATDLLDAAHRDAQACGALASRNAATTALRELGRRPGREHAGTAGSHLLSLLSQRERDIAELLADRLRNREIAERLHLSEKTVERHVSRILAKLGVASRVDVARAVDRDRASR
jgi:DNA-binding CsgD family transcriptional regulator